MANEVVVMDKKLRAKIWWRYEIMSSAAFSQVKMMTAGFCYAMLPWLKKLYPDNKEKLIEAMVRHQAFFNCTPETAFFILGLCMSMEGEYAADPENFDPASISAIKAALMGPLSGVGDAIFWVTVRTIAASVAITLAQNGSMLAPFAFLVIYHVISEPLRWLMLKYGYSLGNNFLEMAYESGYVDMLTMGATTIGLIMVGAMCANFVSLNTAIILSGSGETAQTLQSALDSIFPKLLPLIVSLLTLVGIRKGINVAWLIVIMVIVGIAGVGIGIF